MPSNAQPSPYAGQTVLLALLGTSPAILTETVWALAHPADGGEAIVPHRVIGVGTSKSEEALRSALNRELPEFDGHTGWNCLVGTLAGEGLPVEGRLVLEQFRVVMGRDGNPMAVWLTREQNEQALGFLLKLVEDLTLDTASLVVCMAGGYKTMGALLHSAVTFVGRESDRLTHILVEPPFDRPFVRDTPGFYFPGQPVQTLRPLDCPVVEAAAAKLTLLEVPFVSLRLRPPGRALSEGDLPVGERLRIYNNLMRQRAQSDPPLLTLRHGAMSLEIEGVASIDLANLANAERLNPRRLFLILRFLLEVESRGFLRLGGYRGERFVEWSIGRRSALELFKSWAGLEPTVKEFQDEYQADSGQKQHVDALCERCRRLMSESRSRTRTGSVNPTPEETSTSQVAGRKGWIAEAIPENLSRVLAVFRKRLEREQSRWMPARRWRERSVAPLLPPFRLLELE